MTTERTRWQSLPGRRPLICTVAKEKGGSGGSTAIRAIAATLQNAGANVLVVDANPPLWTCYRWFGFRQEAPIERIRAAQWNDKPGVLDVRETTDPMAVEIGEDRDVVLFDLPGGSFRDHSATVIVRADLVLVPFRVTGEDLDSSANVFTQLRQLEKHRGSPIPTLVLMSSVLRGERYQKSIRQLALGFPAGVQLLGAQIRQSTDWPDSWVAGLTPTEFNPRGNAAADCLALGEEFIAAARCLHV